MRAPAGFPRGQLRFTSGRVIVARSFAGKDAPNADHLAFDPNVSEHGTHVSGILAGASGTSRGPVSGSGRARALGRGARRLARQLPRPRARRPRERRDRLHGGAGGRGRPAPSPTAWTCSTSRSAVRRSIPRPTRSRWRCQCGARRRPVRRRGRQRLRLARLRLDLVAWHERDGDHGRRDVVHARLRRDRAVSAARAPPSWTPFTAVPSIGPRVTRALTHPDAPRRRVGLRPRPARLPRAVSPPRAARCRDRAARRLRLRGEGHQRARGRRAGRDRPERPARPARSSSRRRPTCRCWP